MFEVFQIRDAGKAVVRQSSVLDAKRRELWQRFGDLAEFRVAVLVTSQEQNP
ncbi:MAG: hypothetical protein U0746_14395 [Gemmataceae bacterium]